MAKKKTTTVLSGEPQTDQGAGSRRTERKLNKSKAIREYLKAHPDVMPKPAADKLTKKYGVEFTPAVVSSVKYTMSKTGQLSPTSPRGRGAATAGRAGAGSFNLATLLAAKALVDQVGGVEQAQEVLEVLAKLR